MNNKKRHPLFKDNNDFEQLLAEQEVFMQTGTKPSANVVRIKSENNNNNNNNNYDSSDQKKKESNEKHSPESFPNTTLLQKETFSPHPLNPLPSYDKPPSAEEDPRSVTPILPSSQNSQNNQQNNQQRKTDQKRPVKSNTPNNSITASGGLEIVEHNTSDFEIAPPKQTKFGFPPLKKRASPAAPAPLVQPVQASWNHEREQEDNASSNIKFQNLLNQTFDQLTKNLSKPHGLNATLHTVQTSSAQQQTTKQNQTEKPSNEINIKMEQQSHITANNNENKTEKNNENKNEKNNDEKNENKNEKNNDEKNEKKFQVEDNKNHQNENPKDTKAAVSETLKNSTQQIKNTADAKYPTSKPAPRSRSDSLRFDLAGRLLTPHEIASLPSHLALHHHSTPSKAGYTLDELFLLCRSSVIQQRTIAFSTLHKILERVATQQKDMMGKISLGEVIQDFLLTRRIACVMGLSAKEKNPALQIAILELLHSLLHCAGRNSPVPCGDPFCWMEAKGLLRTGGHTENNTNNHRNVTADKTNTDNVDNINDENIDKMSNNKEQKKNHEKHEGVLTLTKPKKIHSSWDIDRNFARLDLHTFPAIVGDFLENGLIVNFFEHFLLHSLPPYHAALFVDVLLHSCTFRVNVLQLANDKKFFNAIVGVPKSSQLPDSDLTYETQKAFYDLQYKLRQFRSQQ